MQGYKFHNFVIFKIYRLTPFLFELRTLCDWAFSETSLTLFQWIKLDEIHSLLFMAKCNAYYLQNKKVGKLIPLYNKCSLGFCLILVLLGLLFGPLLLYSPLNPTLENDELIGANVEIGLKIQQSNYYSLYINSHVMDIHLVTDEEWK
jgi:piezo-type mechanosensitive ion channel component 1/2